MENGKIFTKYFRMFLLLGHKSKDYFLREYAKKSKMIIRLQSAPKYWPIYNYFLV